MADLPTGTVTFLFTDLEGSTALLQAHPAAYRTAVRRHHELLLGAVEAEMAALPPLEHVVGLLERLAAERQPIPNATER